MKKREAKVRSTLELDAAITYLEDFVKSLKAGRVTVTNGSESLSLNPGPTVRVEFEATQKPEKESVEFKLSWRLPEEASEAPPHLQIGSEEPKKAQSPG